MSVLIRNQKRFLKSYSSTMALNFNYPTYCRRYLTIGYKQQHLLPASLNTQVEKCHYSLSHFNSKSDSNILFLSNGSALSNFNQWRMPLRLSSYHAVRNFQLGRNLYDNPSSKVEATVQTMKKQQKEKVEEMLKEATSCASSPTTDTTMATTKADAGTTRATATAQSTKSSTTSADQTTSSELPSTKTQDMKPVVVKKSLKLRIWEEMVHYYHGFRLLFIDINICRKLLWRVLNGKMLTRRENRLLVRTTSDLFRLIPFSVFIIVPFMELLLPLFIKFFPGMLPSTFQTFKEREDKLKQSLQVKLEMAKFLQKTLDEMAVQHKEHKSEEAKQFANFFQRIKNPKEYISKDELIKYASRFKDEITLDSLSREQLAALCRLLELNTMGTSNFLRFQLRLKLRSLAADDRVIAREGVQSLDLYELQQACKSRGMRAYGLTTERLHAQLQEWIDLSLNEQVPPTLLLLSRALFISDEYTTADKLKETLRVLPDSVAAQTKAAIGELEGKIDNKTKIEVLKEEERKIKEELDEEQEEKKAKSEAEELLDKAPKICSVDSTTTTAGIQRAKEQVASLKAEAVAEDKSISSKDVELISEALKSLSSDKKKMMVEKEQIKEIKEELEDYKEDVEELREVRNVVKEPVRESRAAKMLFKKVNQMLGQLGTVLEDLEKKEQELKSVDGPEPSPEEAAIQRRQQEIVHVNELMQAIKKVQQTSTESRLTQIENVLSKLDADKDGVVTVDEVLKVIEAIGRENVKLDEKQIEDVITLLDKEQLILAEEKIEKALAKSIKEAEIIKAKKQRMELRRIAAEQASLEELKDKAPEIKDIAMDLDAIDKENQKHQTVVKCNALKRKGPCTPQANIRISSQDDEEPQKSSVHVSQTASTKSACNMTSTSPTPETSPTSTSTPTTPPPSATANSSKINSKDKMI